MRSFLNWFILPATPAAVEFEVGSGLDAFVSLEELAPGTQWQELLADAWGVPYSAAVDELQPSPRAEGAGAAKGLRQARPVADLLGAF
jgi:hypothetical protein